MSCTITLSYRLKDQRRRPEGGEWESIKIPYRELGLYPKIDPRPSLLNRSRPHNYSKDVSPRNRVRNHSENTKWYEQRYMRDRWQKSDQVTVYILTGISPNNWWARSRNHRGRVIWTTNPRVFWSDDSRAIPVSPWWSRQIQRLDSRQNNRSRMKNNDQSWNACDLQAWSLRPEKATATNHGIQKLKAREQGTGGTDWNRTLGMNFSVESNQEKFLAALPSREQKPNGEDLWPSSSQKEKPRFSGNNRKSKQEKTPEARTDIEPGLKDKSLKKIIL
jgi:hypothetical protein